MQTENGDKIEQAQRFKFSELCVEVDVEARNGGEERDSLFTTDMRIFNTVVVQDSIVDTLGSGTLLHEGFPFKAAAGDSGKESQIPIRFGVSSSAVRGEGAADTVITGFAASFRAAPLEAAAVTAAEAAINHFVTARADGDAVFINGQALGILEIALVGVVQGDNGVDSPVVQ